MKIMLVDDDEIIREGMKKIILKAGRSWEVAAEAGDGEIALQRLAEQSDIDLLITDVRMPIMDGIELIKRVRETNEKIKIIVLSGYDEFSYVRKAFINGAQDYLLKPFQKQELISRIEKVEAELLEDAETEQHSKRNKNILIADVISHMIKGNKDEVSKDILELEALGVKTDYSYYQVFAIRADQYYKQYPDIWQYQKQLNEDASQIFDFLHKREGFECCCYINEQEIIILLFCNSKEQGEDISKKIYDVLNGRGETYTDTLGISNVHSDLSEAGNTYQEAEEAVLSRFYLGQKRIIHYNEIAGKCVDIQYDLEPTVSQLVHYIEMCDYINTKKIVEQLFLDLSYSKPDKFRKYMHNFIEMLIMRVKDFENVLLVFGQDYQFYIDNLNTYRELKTYVSSILKEMIEYIKSEKEKKSKRRVELAKIYMEEHYHEPITLNDIADYVELNASYFSNLFKAEVGMNFSEYLLNIRMEEAKKLLRDPKIKVYEIGNMIGYEDAVSFGRAFKKKLGMSPKEYRNSVY